MAKGLGSSWQRCPAAMRKAAREPAAFGDGSDHGGGPGGTVSAAAVAWPGWLERGGEDIPEDSVTWGGRRASGSCTGPAGEPLLLLGDGGSSLVLMVPSWWLEEPFSCQKLCACDHLWCLLPVSPFLPHPSHPQSHKKAPEGAWRVTNGTGGSSHFSKAITS